MLVKSKYRLVGKASWGIAINISAEWSALTGPPSNAEELADWLWFRCADRTFPVDDVHFFMLGLKVVADDIEKQRESSGPILINAVDIDYNPTDYQPEGLMPAAACWAAEAFHFPKPEIIGKYDKERRRYAISVQPHTDTLAEEAANLVEPVKTSLERLRGAQQLLQQGHLVPATKRAGNIVRMALQGVARMRDNEDQYSGDPQSVSIEDLVIVLTRPGRRVISPRVKKHAVRVGSWYGDLQFGIRPPNRQEAEAYIHSAEEVLRWAHEVVQHDAI